jgi:hypothetical protein
MMPMSNRHKPSNQLRATTREASDEDYKILAAAVVSAIVNKRRDVVLKLPYFVELDPTFPKGVLYKKDALYNYYRAKAFKLADWLYERGHMSQDAKGVVKSLRSVNNFIGEIDRMLANPEKTVYNDVSVIKEG